MIWQVEIRHSRDASYRLESCPERAGQQCSLHAVIAHIEVIRELGSGQYGQRPFREQATVRQAGRPPGDQKIRRSYTEIRSEPGG